MARNDTRTLAEIKKYVSCQFYQETISVNVLMRKILEIESEQDLEEFEKEEEA